MLRSESVQICLTGDSREISLIEEIKKRNSRFGKFVEKQKIAGIFSSPPYVGLIDYHEQHAYAYLLIHLTAKILPARYFIVYRY